MHRLPYLSKKFLSLNKKCRNIFELLDFYKAILAVVAGLILGFEREMKDKSAGLKTMTVICLGSTLFSILSYKFAGEHGDPTRIASYIVSGIGFLGAGVIFKGGFNVHGLTTAGIIWITAAVGMGIGFGEFYMAFTFLALSLVVIYSAQFLTRNFLPQNHNKILKLYISNGNFVQSKQTIIKDLKNIAKDVNEIGLEKDKSHIVISLDIHIKADKIEHLENYLSINKDIEYFSYH